MSTIATAFVGFAAATARFAGDFGFRISFAMLCLFPIICGTMFVLVIASLMTPERVPGSVSGR